MSDDIFNVLRDSLEATVRQARNDALEAAAQVLERYTVPIGNSAAGELACEWTLDALRECRERIRAMKEKPNETK